MTLRLCLMLLENMQPADGIRMVQTGRGRSCVRVDSRVQLSRGSPLSAYLNDFQNTCRPGSGGLFKHHVEIY